MSESIKLANIKFPNEKHQDEVNNWSCIYDFDTGEYSILKIPIINQNDIIFYAEF